MKPHALFPLAALLAVVGSGPLSASGTRIGFKDADATARGNAFAATADTPAAVYYNPAGLTQITGQEFSATAYVLQLDSDYRSGATTAAMKRNDNLIPQFYYAWAPAGKNYAFGLGAYAPYGLSTEWGPTTPFAAVATKSEQKTYSVPLLAAVQLTPTLSVGAGPVFQRSETTLSRQTVFGEYTFDGAGNTLGFNAGLRWQPSPQHAFGLSYQSNYKINLRGTAEISGAVPAQAANADFVFPEVLIAGWSYRPAPGWNLEFNLDWTNWDRVNTLTINSAAPLGAAQALNWRSSYFYDLGVTRDFGDGCHVSAGYTFAGNSIPDATYTPAIPDADRHLFALGFGCHVDGLDVSLACQYGYSPDRHVQGSPFGLADGTYTNRTYGIALSLAGRF